MKICPHCWNVNAYAHRLCGRCGADMTLILQESGGLRATAAVQSPVPVRAAGRLSRWQRWVVLGFVALIFLGSMLGALSHWGPPRRPAVTAPQAS